MCAGNTVQVRKQTQQRSPAQGSKLRDASSLSRIHVAGLFGTGLRKFDAERRPKMHVIQK